MSDTSKATATNYFPDDTGYFRAFGKDVDGLGPPSEGRMYLMLEVSNESRHLIERASEVGQVAIVDVGVDAPSSHIKRCDIAARALATGLWGAFGRDELVEYLDWDDHPEPEDDPLDESLFGCLVRHITGHLFTFYRGAPEFITRPPKDLDRPGGGS